MAGGNFCEGTCGAQASKIFFVLFYLVANVVILNIIVATLLEQVAAAELPLQGALTTGACVCVCACARARRP